VNTQFFATQGTTLGGNDTIDGGGGTDELFSNGLSDILIVGTFGAGDGQHILQGSTSDGSITYRAEVTNIEQFFFAEASGNAQRLLIDFDQGGVAFVIAGTSGDDTINAFGNGNSSADFTFGSLTLDVDTADVFGALVFGGDGDDTITTSGNEGDLIFGGDGDDTIISKAGANVIQSGGGDDTIIVATPADFRGDDSDSGDDISGGTNGATGDTLQIGTASTSTGENFVAQQEGDGFSVTIVGIENLNFFKSNTTFQMFADSFLNITNITAESGVSGIILKGAGSTLNLSTVNVASAVSTLTAISSLGDGVRVFDASDSVGRTLIGSADGDTLSGFGGDDIFQMGGGRDALSGGDGDDIFQIAAASDITSGIILSGGAGTDTLSLTSTSISSLVFPFSDVSFSTLESFDISGGASSGVSITMTGDDLNDIPKFVGDGTKDVINVFADNFNAADLTFDGIEQINLTETISSDSVNPGTFQRLEFDSDTSITGLDTISGTVDTSGNSEDEILLSGSRDFSGITFTNINKLNLDDDIGSRQSIEANASTSLGLTIIGGFNGGSGSTTDQFDYKNDLISGDGTTVGASSDFTLTEINSNARATNVISSNTTGVIDFESTVNTTNLGIDITSSTLSEITSAAEALLESTDASTNLTGSSAQVAAGARNTDSLLIFYDNNEDAVIVRYQEGSTSEADFSGELSVVAIFDDPSDVSTFDDVNIV
jgi:hypothetical protein